ncbi:5866_t:CDS:2 [Cetraspora pellucida]|uniref:5866_t:CDS:1 n=1 Tax=Cetraspora pellucida TaxID=1433469 RepID=A0ACA9NYT1_9GLOM|nr:5866_t:CDS:2 [Cetraspora pellucida]
MSITLFCLVHGSIFENAFPVKIKKNEAVGQLKKLIKEENKQTFASIDAKDLRLWKVNIPLDSPNNKRSALEADPKGDRLLPVDDIKEHFDKPAKKHIHVIVELPASFGEFVKEFHKVLQTSVNFVESKIKLHPNNVSLPIIQITAIIRRRLIYIPSICLLKIGIFSILALFRDGLGRLS